MTLPSRALPLATSRLLLRPSGAGEAERAFEIQSNWNVTRMLRMAAWPPERRDIAGWFASHEREWAEGSAYRFTIILKERMIGLIDLDAIHDRTADLGYWLGEAFWGRGFAREAGDAVVRFAFEEAGMRGLRSGHADDNPASGRVLLALGFVFIDAITIPSRSRGGLIVQRRYRLAGPPHPGDEPER